MAKLKDGKEFDTHGTGKVFKGEIADNIANYLLENEIAKEEDFVELPTNKQKKEKK